MARVAVVALRALGRRHAYILGCAAALLLWSLWRYVPSKPVALLMLGLTPFLVRLAPASYRPNPESIVRVRSTASPA